MMQRSLVARLTLLIAGIIVFAFAVLVFIVHKTTSTTFTESQIEVHSSESPNETQDKSIAILIEAEFDSGGWPAVQNLLNETRFPSDREARVMVVVDLEFEISAFSHPWLARAVVQEEPEGKLLFEVTHESLEYSVQYDLSQGGTTWLTNRDNKTFGYLFFVPNVNHDISGDRFAWQVWRSAAVWLILTLGMAMLLTSLILRRSLRPIRQLTQAARQLERGSEQPIVINEGDTEFSPLIDAFNATTEAIANTKAMRNRLISDIAHELRTPLTNIKGQLEAAQAKLIKTDQELLGTLASETKLLERLVADFQELAISDAGQLRIVSQCLPLKELMFDLLSPYALQSSVRLELCIRQDISIQADEERMRQVFGNLMENAIRHKPHDLEVHVEASIENEYVKLVFADNGYGIGKEHQPLIFERFYRAEESRNRETGGAGLGLAIVKAMIEAMNGSIIYVDQEGQSGAAFEIRLPKGTE